MQELVIYAKLDHQTHNDTSTLRTNGQLIDKLQTILK